MPKSQTIEPSGVRAAQFIQFSPIPVNQYRGSLIDELASGHLSRGDAVRIHGDMVLIRAFESMLESVKKWGHYGEVKYDHRGPAHLSIGQEAVAVGQAFLLDIHDHIFGSHRSHGEILAKGLSVIAKLDEPTLLEIMSNHFDGACLRIVEKNGSTAVKDLAVDALVFGTLAEIFRHESGSLAAREHRRGASRARGRPVAAAVGVRLAQLRAAPAGQDRHGVPRAGHAARSGAGGGQRQGGGVCASRRRRRAHRRSVCARHDLCRAGQPAGGDACRDASCAQGAWRYRPVRTAARPARPHQPRRAARLSRGPRPDRLRFLLSPGQPRRRRPQGRPAAGHRLCARRADEHDGRAA